MFKNLEEGRFENEDALCQPVCKLLTDVFAKRLDPSKGFSVIDAHTQNTLGHLRPDIIILQKATTLVPQYLSTFVELKNKNIKPLDSKENLGQVLDYLLAMKRY